MGSNNNNIYIDNVKKDPINRELTVILKGKSPKILNDFCDRFNKVNRNISSRLDQMMKLTRIVPRRVTLTQSSPFKPFINENSEFDIDAIGDPSNLRIILNFESIDGKYINDSIIGKNISHLVEISLIDHSNNDLNSYESSSATIYVSSTEVDKICKIIEDIMIDISMFNTFFNDNNSISLEKKRDFSYVKVAYAVKQKLSSTEWDVNRNKGYISLAGYFWDKGKFNIGGYCNCWDEIKKEMDVINDILPVKAQLKKHTSYHQLPVNKIEKEYNLLEPGEYVLARITKVPNKEKSYELLRTLFGGSKVRVGKVRLFPKNMKILYSNNLKQYITLYPLYK
ncbi:hypothetical protein AGMMS49574_29200 [Bacteroidia bacterium]|nr:hypothetical protein AGMMS49574_29200 [Bacteroidia bacterium]